MQSIPQLVLDKEILSKLSFADLFSLSLASKECKSISKDSLKTMHNATVKQKIDNFLNNNVSIFVSNPEPGLFMKVKTSTTATYYYDLCDNHIDGNDPLFRVTTEKGYYREGTELTMLTKSFKRIILLQVYQELATALQANPTGDRFEEGLAERATGNLKMATGLKDGIYNNFVQFYFPLCLTSNAGGGPKQKPYIKTNKRVTLSGKRTQNIVYINKRGTEFVKVNRQFVRLSSLK